MPEQDERIIVCKLVLPTEALPALLRALAAPPHSRITLCGVRIEIDGTLH
jgi:hypothetical protein